jgi:hypothetical protein
MAKKKLAKKKSAPKKKVPVLKRVAKKKVAALPENAVRVPRPVKKSFNAKRPLSRNLLLANQVMHFHEIEQELPPRQRSGLALEDIKTEGQAADFIKHVTLRLHKQKKGNA